MVTNRSGRFIASHIGHTGLIAFAAGGSTLWELARYNPEIPMGHQSSLFLAHLASIGIGFDEAGAWTGAGAMSGPGLGATYSGAPATGGILSKLGLTKGAGSWMPSALGWGAAATAAPLVMGAMGKWAPDEQFDELQLKSQQFGFDYDQMISDIQAAVESGDEGEVMKVMVKYNLSRGDMPKAKYIGTAAEGGRIGYNLGGIDRPFQGN